MNTALSQIKPSPTIEFADYVRSLEASGEKILKLQTGEPSYSVPSDVLATVAKAMQDGQDNYCHSQGLLSLRSLLLEKLNSTNKINVDTEDEILITAGAVQGLSLALKTLLQPGDEVIVLEPYWYPYEANIILNGGKAVIVRSTDTFHPDIELISQSITEKTKAIIINSPNNPSGAVYTQAELQKILDLCSEKGIYIISDEVYEDFDFSSHKHVSISSLSEYDKVISLFSFSKSYAMTGYRIGYVHAHKDFIAHSKKVAQQTMTCVSPFIQLAACTAIKSGPSPFYSQLSANRELILEANQQLPQLLAPEGAMYALIDVSSIGTSLEIAKKLVKDHGLSLTPGIAFGPSMDKYLRLCFAVEKEDLNQAIEVLKRSLL